VQNRSIVSIYKVISINAFGEEKNNDIY